MFCMRCVTQSKMEDRGSSMTDTSPLMKIKSALAKLRAEMKDMDLRIGVVGHSLMQSKMRVKAGTVGDSSGFDEDAEFEIDSDGDDDEDSEY